MDILIFGLMGAILIGGGLLIALFSWRSIGTDDISARLNQYVAEETGSLRPARRFVIVSGSRDLSGSLPNRIFLPLVKTSGSSLGV